MSWHLNEVGGDRYLDLLRRQLHVRQDVVQGGELVQVQVHHLML